MSDHYEIFTQFFLYPEVIFVHIPCLSILQQSSLPLSGLYMARHEAGSCEALTHKLRTLWPQRVYMVGVPACITDNSLTS